MCTAVAFALYPRFELSNLVMVYLLGVTVAGLRFGRGPAVLTAMLNVAAFDFFFVPPRFSFAVSDAQYLRDLRVMLTIALVIANLMASVRQQTRVAGARERRTALLYAMSRELAATRGISGMARVAVSHVAEVFQCQAVVLLPDARRQAALSARSSARAVLSIARISPSRSGWPITVARRGSAPTPCPPRPLFICRWRDERQRLGVLAVLPSNPRRVLLPEQRHLLETFAGQIGLALERARLAEAAEARQPGCRAREPAQYAAGLHLARPAHAACGYGGRRQHARGAWRGSSMRPRAYALARSIETKAREMSELVSNVLDLMRFESGQVVLRRDWQTLDDLVGTALQKARSRSSQDT